MIRAAKLSRRALRRLEAMTDADRVALSVAIILYAYYAFWVLLEVLK